MYPMFFQQMEKKAAKRRKWVLNISGKDGLLYVIVSFTTLISPSLLLCLVCIHATREWEIQQIQLQLYCTKVGVFVLQLLQM